MRARAEGGGLGEKIRRGREELMSTEVEEEEGGRRQLQASSFNFVRMRLNPGSSNKHLYMRHLD